MNQYKLIDQVWPVLAVCCGVVLGVAAGSLLHPGSSNHEGNSNHAAGPGKGETVPVTRPAIEELCVTDPDQVLIRICPTLGAQEAAEQAALAFHSLMERDPAGFTRHLSKINDSNLLAAALTSLEKCRNPGLENILSDAVDVIPNWQGLAVSKALTELRIRRERKSSATAAILDSEFQKRNLLDAWDVCARLEPVKSLEWLSQRSNHIPGADVDSLIARTASLPIDKGRMMDWLSGRELTNGNMQLMQRTATTWARSDGEAFSNWFAKCPLNIRRKLLKSQHNKSILNDIKSLLKNPSCRLL